MSLPATTSDTPTTTPPPQTLADALNEELSRPNVSVQLVRMLCQRAMAAAAAAATTAAATTTSNSASPTTESSSDDPNAATTSSTTSSSTPTDHSVIPHALRPLVWKTLLGCNNKDEHFFDAFDFTTLALDDKQESELIRLDSRRTRPNDPHCVLSDARRDEISHLVTYYCKKRGIPYTQGLGELVVPFLVVTPPTAMRSHDLAVVFNCFYSLLDRFLAPIFGAFACSLFVSTSASHQLNVLASRVAPFCAAFVGARATLIHPPHTTRSSEFNFTLPFILLTHFTAHTHCTTDSKEFESLQCIFRFFRLLMQYHDPALCHYVDQFDILPELCG
jgi:hypothetical protein